jgi:hypothetical protein
VDVTVSWIARINAVVLRRIARGRVKMSADAKGIGPGDNRYPYADLERAVAYCQPNLVGDDMVVLLDFGNERLIGVSHEDATWKTVTQALDAHPRNRMPYVEWSVRLVADPTAQLDLLSPR